MKYVYIVSEKEGETAFSSKKKTDEYMKKCKEARARVLFVN